MKKMIQRCSFVCKI